MRIGPEQGDRDRDPAFHREGTQGDQDLRHIRRDADPHREHLQHIQGQGGHSVRDRDTRLCPHARTRRPDRCRGPREEGGLPYGGGVPSGPVGSECREDPLRRILLVQDDGCSDGHAVRPFGEVLRGDGYPVGHRRDQEADVRRERADRRTVRLSVCPSEGDVREDVRIAMEAYCCLFGVTGLYVESLVDEAIRLVELDPPEGYLLGFAG